MRLINIYTLEMKEFVTNIPAYAILSHRWSDDEITLKEFKKNLKPESIGYQKLKRFCAFVNDFDSLERVEWIWIDTCCIDKRGSAELSEAINSMYDWYYRASYCVAYLSDVSTGDATSGASMELEEELRESEWFSRGWTLQELLAPERVQFCSQEEEKLGTKLSLI